MLVDSPGLGESDLMSNVAKDFIHKASCLACVVNASRGVVTLQFRDFLGESSGDTIGAESSLVICNKWGQLTPQEHGLIFFSFFFFFLETENILTTKK